MTKINEEVVGDTVTGVIKQLDELTASKIAAGEVVERPVSVVKELVENSIDAGAGHITVRLMADEDMQYIDEIQVIDDGCGMLAVDLPRAFGRHATSKLGRADDLSFVRTLGFRGEALPSIAAVSRVEVQSCAKGADCGYSVLAAEGKVDDMGEVAIAEGTKIMVHNLFYNTPARKKFLKSYATETGYISKLLGDFILSRPDIAFTLEIDGRSVLRSPGGGNLQKAVLSVYGAEVLSALRPVSWQEGEVIVRGFVSMPPFARSSRRYYHFFVNGRLVRSQDLNGIVDMAYTSLMPENKHPLVILYFEVPTQTVDVNVHPAKTEIRFHKLADVREAALQAVRHALLLKTGDTKASDVKSSDMQASAAEVGGAAVASVSEKQTEQSAQAENGADGMDEMKLIMSILSGHIVKDDENNSNDNEGKKYEGEQSDLLDLFKPAKAAEDAQDLSGDLNIEAKTEASAENVPENVETSDLPELSDLSGAEITSLLGSQQKDDPDFATRMFQSLLTNAPGKKVEYKRDDGDWLAENFGITYLEDYDSKQQQLFDAESNLFLALKPLGQLNNSYIIATLGEDLYVIDQHAAHERILYEEFVLAFALDSRETSLLAVPVRIDVGDLHTELLLNNIARLADFGFVLEHFGGSSFVIRGVPLWYVRGSESDNRRKSQVYDNDIAGFFLEVFDMLLEGADDDVLDIARLNQLELFTKACKSAIKANEHLNGQEISWLLYNLAECEKPQTCPHGRPTFFKMTDAEIRKRFMRS